MQIVLTTFAGDETFTLEVNSSDMLEDVKHQIQEKIGFAPYLVRVYLAGRLLRDGEKLSDYNVQEGTKFHIMHG